MLTIFRRHLARCLHRAKGRRYRACQCPIMVEGRLHGKMIRKSLDIASWEGAQATVREWEALGSITGEAVAVEDAVKRYLADCDARNLKKSTIDKQRLFLTRHFAPWCEGKGIRLIGAISVDDLREFRQSWNGAPITALKRLSDSVRSSGSASDGCARTRRNT